MAHLYGFFNNKVYRMSTKKNVAPKVVEPFQSTTYLREDSVNRSITNVIKVNSMDYFAEESNDALYNKLIGFIKASKISGIETLFYQFKIGLDYQICDHNGTIIDAGVRYIQTDADEVAVLLDPDPMTNALPYRKAEYVNEKFAISKFSPVSYGVMDRRPKGVTFRINTITILANLTDMGSEYYIQNLGPSAQDTTFCYGSGTINSITNHSIVLFDTASMGITIPAHKLNYVPETIYVSVEALLNQFCAVFDDTEIWEIIETYGGEMSQAPSDFDIPDFPESPFDPVVDRKPCPGNYPMPPHMPHRPGHKPPHKPGHPGRPCPPPPPPRPLEPSKPPKPIIPGENWDPEGSIVPKPDYNQDHGDLNEGEWCLASEYDPEHEKFIVVSDDMSESEFDATTMVRLEDVLPFITDVQVGDYVKKSDVLYW